MTNWLTKLKALFKRPEPAKFIRSKNKREGLRKLIRNVEANGNYNAYYGNASNSNHPKFTEMTIFKVMQWQREFVRNGSRSSAVGAYQFLRRTLNDVYPKAGLKDSDLFSEANQDKMADVLLDRRGWNSYQKGIMSKNEFANKLAREWASFPVMNTQKGSHQTVNRGQSYYAGDSLNKALVSPTQVLEVL